MGYNQKPSQVYLRNAVMTAPPEQLQLMLFDGAIRFTLQGLAAIEAKGREAAFNALERAQRIVLELNNGIRREVNPELADQTASLYSFVYKRLVDGNINQDVAAIQEALKILRHQRETWVMVITKLRQEQAHGAAPAPVAPAKKSAEPPSRFRPDAPSTGFTAEA
jgi:flagellar secretion chaperone FliS